MNNLYLITRAAHQAESLVSAIENEGGCCITFPCMDILPPEDMHSVNGALEHIEQFDHCIFTSSNAVPMQFSAHPKNVIAIGPGTAAALKLRGVESLMPDRYSSEGLLDLDALQSIEQQKIAIFTGENPRPLLAETLTARDAVVTEVYCYRRHCPKYSAEEIMSITTQPIDTIIITSLETLNNLYRIFEDYRNWLLDRTLLVTSPKMRHAAETLGFQSIIQSTDSTSIAIVSALSNTY